MGLILTWYALHKKMSQILLVKFVLTQEPNGIYSQLEPRSEVDDKGHLTSRNLLDFSRQIAAGMVSQTKTNCGSHTCKIAIK